KPIERPPAPPTHSISDTSAIGSKYSDRTRAPSVLQVFSLRRDGRSRFGELRRVNRDVRLHISQLDSISTRHPRKGPLERQFDPGNVPIIIEVDLRGDPAHRRVGVAHDAREQA